MILPHISGLIQYDLFLDHIYSKVVSTKNKVRGPGVFHLVTLHQICSYHDCSRRVEWGEKQKDCCWWLPLGRPDSGSHPCADWHSSGVIPAIRPEALSREAVKHWWPVCPKGRKKISLFHSFPRSTWISSLYISQPVLHRLGLLDSETKLHSHRNLCFLNN